jgi:tripartite-type tricarboxylate transporter receptor subunit TctC
MKTVLKICATLLLAACAHAVQAQSYPSKPIRLIVAFAAGGNTDVVARVIAPKLGELLGQQVVVENRPGGGTVIGTEALARSAPDGHTIMLTGFDFTIAPSLYSKLPYDPQRDFAPIALIASYPMALVASPSLPAQSVKDVIALAKASPGRINYASAGNGSPGHLSGELLKGLAGVELTHIPYKGTGAALTDLMAGQVQLIFTGYPAVSSFVQNGRLKLLAVTGTKRDPALPTVPTVAEGGVPGYEVVSWLGFIAPAGVPRATVDRLNTEIARALQSPEVRERLAVMGGELGASTPEAFGKLLRDESSKWARVVQGANIKID